MYMAKKNVMISIDEDLHRKCKEKLLNISGEVDSILRKRLSENIVTIDQAEKCEFCGREGIKETAETINTNDSGLTWLYPDEKWICNHCLTRANRTLKP